ncbi:hypothetical protein ACA910_021327 [Epithemia clementina (nom. ined.)]
MRQTPVLLRIEALNHHQLPVSQHFCPWSLFQYAQKSTENAAFIVDQATSASTSSARREDTSPADDNVASVGSPNAGSAWSIMANHIAMCLCKTSSTSPKELTGMEGTSTGWANWIDEETSSELQHKILDRLELATTKRKTEDETLQAIDPSSIIMQYQSRRCLTWMLNAPKPFVWDISVPLQVDVSKTLLTKLYQTNQTKSNAGSLGNLPLDIREMISQVSCRILALPSGQCLSRYLDTPVGTMVFGKVLSGGVERFRLLGSPSSPKPLRKVGQRIQVARKYQRMDAAAFQKATITNSSSNPTNPCWLQYGGGRRSYQALDVGPCIVWELALSPKANEMALMGASLAQIKFGGGINDDESSYCAVLRDYEEMSTLVPLAEAESTSHMLDHLFVLVNENTTVDDTGTTVQQKPDLQASFTSIDFQTALTTSLGGLEPQIDEIIRRVLDGRSFAPYNENDTMEANNGSTEHNWRSTTAKVNRQNELATLWEFGIKPVRGLLLYGKPGCGKTLLARELSRLIRARPPKIVAAPDLLDKWVGGTEAMIRKLFEDAEEELRACKGDFTRSSLHVIVIDECDALFRIRSSETTSSGEITRASAVNQILSKLDGVKSLDNILLIAMTNRKELLDPALLRPGRLEVQIECPLPDVQGRREILQIQLNGFRRANRLSQPLLEAVYAATRDQSLDQQSPKRLHFARDIWDRFRSSRFFVTNRNIDQQHHGRKVDLALDEYTGGFSGADLAGLVRCAGSLALARWRQQQELHKRQEHQSPSSLELLEGLTLTLPDFMAALEEIKQSRL